MRSWCERILQAQKSDRLFDQYLKEQRRSGAFDRIIVPLSLALFAEREDGVMRLRRGFAIAAGTRCLVVEDVITTGGSTREVMRVVEEAGGILVGVGALIDRGGGSAAFPVKKVTLATLSVPTYRPEECPLCRSGSPAVKSGSRK